MGFRYRILAALMRRANAIFWWWLGGVVAVCLLPWNMLQDGFRAGNALALFATDADSANALGQALFHGRWWFWPIMAALLIAAASLLPWLDKRRRGDLLLAGGWLGVVAIATQGWLIGVQGWSYDALTQAFGELNDRQFGIGWGGCIAFTAFVVLTTTGLALHGRFGGDRFVAGAVGLLVASILLFTVWPVLTI